MERSLPTEDHMQIASSYLDGPQMGYSGLRSVNNKKDHDMCDNNRNKECYVVKKFESQQRGIA